MEIGIFSRTYEETSYEDVLRRMTADGIFHTQLNLVSTGLPSLPEEAGEEQILRIRDLHERYHVTVDALSGTFNMIDPDPDRRQRGIRQFALQCRIAKLLEAPIVTLCTGSRHPADKWTWHEGNLSGEAWADLIRTTEAILPFAEENGLSLGVEPEINNIICSAERARRYLDEMGSPAIGIIMDAANLFHPGEEGQMRQVIDNAFDLLERDIILAHAKDFIPVGADGHPADTCLTPDRAGQSCLAARFQMCGPGQGILDFDHVIGRLRACGYKGTLIMHGMGAVDAVRCRRYLEEKVSL